MKVLHVAECVGGVDRYLRSFLKYSTSENIVILSQLYDKKAYEELAISVDIMKMSHKVGFSAIMEAIVLRKKIKKYSPDIVYAHSSIAGAITRMACVGLKSKVVYNPHGWSFNIDNSKNTIFVFLERLMSHFCDAIICISEAEKVSAIEKKICKENKLHVINNGIDIEEYDNQELGVTDFPIPDGAFVVGMVGRICKQKAPDIFIRMAGEVKKKIKNSYFVIVGDVIEGSIEERKYIEELANRVGINLCITGWVDNPINYMKKFDVGCLLSRWEGFGLAIPEYMYAGTPIVATNVDAIPYLVVDGESGLLIEKDDWKGGSEKVIELERNKQLKDLLINNGYLKVRKKFDIRRTIHEHECLFTELLYSGVKNEEKTIKF